MKSFITILGAGLFALFFLGCDHTTPVSTDDVITLFPGPGSFGLGYMKGLSKSVSEAAAQSGTNVSFDLGNIKGSSSFYFLLYNTGRTPITSVTLSVADSQFLVYPSAMDTLMPGGDIGMLPVVKVSAIHGTALDGFGFRPLMHKGKNSGRLIITGKTKTCRGNDTTVLLSANLTLNALVMDVLVLCGHDTVNMSGSTGGFIGNFAFDDFEVVNMRGFGSNYRGDSISLINTGNIPVSICVKYYNEFDGSIKETLRNTLDTSRKVTVSRGKLFPNYSLRPIFCLDGKNTIADHSRLPLEPNGKCYFQWFPYDSLPVNTPKDSLNLGPFKTLARSATCVEKSNALYLIDSTLVFWDRQGNCPDNSYEYDLFKVSSIDSVVCRYFDSIAGLQEQCLNPTFHGMLDTIVANLSDTALGLGSSHNVQSIPLGY